MKTQLVFFLFNVSKDYSEIDLLLRRHIIYTENLRNSKFRKPIVYVSGSGKEIDDRFTKNLHLIEISKKNVNLLNFAFRVSINLIKKINQEDKLIFVAGTPFQPLVISVLLKKIYSNSKVQVTFHNDLTAWFFSGFKNKFKYVLVRKLIKNIEIIRFVSESQKLSAEKYLNLKSKTIVVCPVPIEYENFKLNLFWKKSGTIAYIGRLHKERNFEEWINILTELKNYIGIIVGNNSKNIGDSDKEGNVIYFGKLENKKLGNLLKLVEIHLSTANYESYGLSIRESLLTGTYVLTKNTLGVQDIVTKFPKIIFKFDTKEEAISIISKIGGKGRQKSEFTKFRNYFIANQRISIAKLNEAWSDD